MRKIVSFVSALVIIAMQKYGKSFKLATNFLKSSTIICEKCFVTHEEPALIQTDCGALRGLSWWDRRVPDRRWCRRGG